MPEIVEIGPWRLLLAYIFVLIPLILIKWQGIGKEKELLVSALRMTAQLIAVGYLLVYLFEIPSPWIALAVLAIMQLFAIRNVFSRIKLPINRKLRHIIAATMFTGTTVTLFFFLLAVIKVDPWYDPRYFIPLGGLLIGNSMTGVSLGVERLISEFQDKRDLVEGALMLGATPKAASTEIVKNTFSSAILPTINSMVGMGIIFLPGMMTGQILAGISPLVAIEYQIAVMLGILGSVSITIYLLVQWGYNTFFNRWSQLEISGDL